MSELTPENIVSTSHHIVSIRDGKVFKNPRNDTPEALAEILQDYEYLKMIGYDVDFEDNVLIMPFIGQPLDTIEPDMEELLKAIDHAQKSLPLPYTKNKIGKEVYNITKQKIKERLPENDYKLKKRTKTAMRTARRILNKRVPQVISHTDTHAKNFLKDDTGKIHLIDWESSIAGLPEFDLAVLYVYLRQEMVKGIITQDQADNAYKKYIEPRIVDKEAYDAFTVFKLVRHLSWAYLFEAPKEIEYLVEEINETMEPYVEKYAKKKEKQEA